MKPLRWTLGGLVGGVVGAGVWALIAHFTHREIGWIAWIVGVIVGLGVRITARDDDGPLPGGIAAILAMLAVFGGKYLAVAWAVESVSVGVPIDESDVVVATADEIAAQWSKEGKALTWPPGKNAENAAQPEDYPSDVLEAARKAWTDLGPTDQQKRIAALSKQRAELIGQVKGAMRSAGYKSSSSVLDILWVLLAVGSAYKLGSGTASDD